MLETNEIVIKIIMANHIGMWKKVFLMVSFKIGIAGTGIKKPPIIAYNTNTIPNNFHHIPFINSMPKLIAPKVWK